MAPATAAMPPSLTPVQRRTYESLRQRLQVLMLEYDGGFRQHTLADSVGASQSFVSKVMRGTVTSIPVLERVARGMMLRISNADRRALKAQLDSSLRVFRVKPTR